MPEQGIDLPTMIAQLRARRDALDEAIGALERLAVVGEGLSGSAPGTPPVKPGTIPRDAFFNMNTQEAAEAYLGMVGFRNTQTTDQMVAALQQGGIKATKESIVTILIRTASKDDNKIVRVSRGIWGHADWYGGKPKKKTGKRTSNSNAKESEEEGDAEAEGEETTGETSTSES